MAVLKDGINFETDVLNSELNIKSVNHNEVKNTIC